MKILLVTALRDEALPWIEKYELSNTQNHFYENGNISVIILGLGKKNINNRLHDYFEDGRDISSTLLFNVGIAGGHRKLKLGAPYFINKILDQYSGKTFFPECLIQHGLPEIDLVTVQEFVSNNLGEYPGAVDMEASEIFSTARKWLPLHRMVFIKVISDHMDITDWKSLDIKGLINKNLVIINGIINKYAGADLAHHSILSLTEIRILEKGGRRLRLTAAQNKVLIESAENFKKNSMGSLKELNKYFKMESRTLRTRNKIFMEIREFLST